MKNQAHVLVKKSGPMFWWKIKTHFLVKNHGDYDRRKIVIGWKFHLFRGKLWSDENFTWSSRNYDRRTVISRTDVSRPKKKAKTKNRAKNKNSEKQKTIFPVSEPLSLAHPGKKTPFGRTPHSDVLEFAGICWCLGLATQHAISLNNHVLVTLMHTNSH